jgi:hypothetical protein
MNGNKNNNTRRGLSFSDLLGVAFIVLKLCGVISWSWIWVLAPLWSSWIVITVLCIIKNWNKNFKVEGLE